MSTALAPTVNHAVAILDAKGAEELIRPFLPVGVSYDRVRAAAQLAAQKNPALLQCTPQSVVMAVAKIMQWGLEIGETAHLVPFRDKKTGDQICTPIADYKGLAELMIDSGAVRHVDARCVYANEFFEEVQGTDARLTHHPSRDIKARGALIGAYCILRLPFGVPPVHEFMPLGDIDAIRKQHSRQWRDGACPGWYAKKTVVRQVSKLLPKGKKSRKVLEVIEQEAQEEFGAIEATGDEDVIVAPGQPLRLERSEPAADAGDTMLLERTMPLADAEAFIIPRGKVKGQRVDSLTPVQMQAALLWTVEEDTEPEFQLALATVLDAREKEAAKQAQESEAEGAPAGDAGAAEDSPPGNSPSAPSAASAASAAIPEDPDPYPDGTEGLTPGQLKSKAIELLKHPAIAGNSVYVAGTKQQLATGLSIHQLRATVRTIESMIASAPVKGKKGPHRIGDLPGDPA